MSTQYIRYPAASSGGGGVPTYANLASFPSGPSDGQLGIALDTHLLYEYNLGLLSWQVIGGANLVLSIGTVDSQTPSADGAVIASNALVMQSASATVPGLMSTAAQSFAGTKTFNASILANGGVDASGTLTLGSAATTINIGNAGSVVNIQGTTIYENTPILQVVDPKITLNKGGAAGSGQNSGIEIEEAGSITGYLETSASRNDFSMKAPATAGVITFTPGASGFTIDQGSHNPVTIGTANGLSLSTQVLSLDAASASVPGAVTTGAQTFAGAKTFSSAPILSSLSASLPLKLDASKNVTAAAIDLSGSEVTSTLAIGNGGTGATTQQAAINALTGTQTNAYYLRSNGTNASLSALAAADLSGTVAIANGGTGQSTASAGFDALSPNTTKGDITVRSSTSNTRLAVGSDGQVLVADSSQTLGVKWATAAQGAKNYITYNNFENNATTGWSLSHTTLSSNIPNQASGSWTSASGNLSMSVVSSGQLAGSYSLSLASSAATTAGDMLVSQAYTIDLEDQAKPLTFKFYYSATSNSSNLNFSGTSSNTYQIYIYDVANSAWIQPAGVYGMTQGSGVGYVTGTFQTPSNMTSFRIAIVCINASAGANTIYFDDFFLGPQTAPLGAAVSDWVPYTATVAGFGTISSSNFEWRRVGDSVQVKGRFTSGTSTATAATISLPNGIIVDSTKVPNQEELGEWHTNSTATSGFLFVSPGGNTMNMSIGTGLNNSNGNAIAASGGVVVFSSFSIPISGWSSNVQMSNDTDTRVISAFYNGQPTGTLAGSDNLITIPTKVIDTSASMSSGTYTVPVAGKYSVTAQVGLNTSSATANQYFILSIKQNGTLRAENVIRAEASSIDSRNPQVHAELDCAAGDTITLASNTNMTSVTYNSTVTRSYVRIERLSGPATIAATETVTASYTTAAGQSISNSTADIINFDTKDFDTHGAVTTGASWKFTAPISGFYNVSSVILFASSAATQGNAIDLQVFKNGSVYKRMSYKTIESTLTNFIGTQGQAAVTLNAGDYIDIRVSYNRTGGNTSLHNSSTYNHVEISRIK